MYTEDWEDAEDGDYTLVKEYGDCTSVGELGNENEENIGRGWGII